jgi:hypothetical protein
MSNKMTKLRQLKFSSLVTKEVTKVHKGQFMPLIYGINLNSLGLMKDNIN